MPLVATVVGVLILGEHLIWNQPLGAAIVLAGVAISQGALSRRRRDPGPPGEPAVVAEPGRTAAPS
jgi:threonine/homoserine efflux transporter RhtA